MKELYQCTMCEKYYLIDGIVNRVCQCGSHTYIRVNKDTAITEIISKRNKEISLINLVIQCAKNLEYYKGWFETGHILSASKCLYKAIGILELMEISICGSVGGFDKVTDDKTGQLIRQQNTNDNRFTKNDVFQRLHWIWVYHTDLPISKKLTFCTFEDLVRFFSSNNIFD